LHHTGLLLLWKHLHHGLPNTTSTCLADHLSDDLPGHIPHQVPKHKLVKRNLAGIIRVRDNNILAILVSS
jgi:hypothetical protein